MAYEDNFKVWGPYTSKISGRKLVIVVDKAGKKRTISYPKWVAECVLERPLDPNLETVDHIDGNIDNNLIDNFQILDRVEHSKQDTRRVKNIKLNCSLCGAEFERSPRLLRDKSKKGVNGIFCSRQCAGKYSRMLQLKQIDKFPPQPYIESEYFKLKDIQATADYFCKKYAIFLF